MQDRVVTILADRDPGLLRLTAAARAVLVVALTLGLATAFGASGPVLIAGGFLGVVTELAVGDLRPRDQLLTLFGGLFVSLAALVAGGLLASAPTPVRVSTFLAVILGSVYVRRFGRRGHGLGVFGFMTFFLTQFLGTAAGPHPALLAVAPAAIAIAALVRVAVLPTPGPATRTRALRAWDRLLAATVRQTATLLRTSPPTRRVERALNRSLDRLRACTRLVETLPAQAVTDAETTHRRILAAESAAHRLAVIGLRAAHAAPPGRAPTDHLADRDRLITELLALAHAAQHRTTDGRRLDRLQRHRTEHERPRVSPELRHGYRAIGELAHTLVTPSASPLSPPSARKPQAQAQVSIRPGPPLDHQPTARRHFSYIPYRPTTRQAYQVTAAAALAAAGGMLLSAHQWYWAVATAWVVFVDMTSTGQIFLRSLRRLTGTITGVLLGFALAVPAASADTVATVLLAGCLFGIFYAPATAYGAVTFFITGALGVLLTLLHGPAPELLVLRVTETALGVACGTLAAAVLLPTTTRGDSDRRLGEVLTALHEVTRELRHDIGEAEQLTDEPPTVDRTRELDRAAAEFHRSILPLLHPLNPHRSQRAHAALLFAAVQVCVYHARCLTALARCAAGNIEPADRTRLAHALLHIEHAAPHRTRHTNHGVHAPTPQPPSPHVAALTLLADEPPFADDHSTPAHRLALHAERLDGTLRTLTTDPIVSKRSTTRHRLLRR